MIDKENVTYEDYAAFEGVRRYGRWNMFDARAKTASGLDDDIYFEIIRDFNNLTELYKERYNKEHTKVKEEEIK